MKKVLKTFILIGLLNVVGITLFAQKTTFTNPLLPTGADPYSIYKDGFYYYMHTTVNNLTLWKTKNLADLQTAETKIVWEPPAGTLYSKNIWAPEIQYLKGKWYIYFAADDGHNDNHRMYVIENSSSDPFKGEWVFKGKIADSDDKWAIDGDVFEHNGKLYMVWSGWEGNTNGHQEIYIAKMKNPWTIEGKRVKLSEPEYDWEKNGNVSNDASGLTQINVNEGPQYLRHKNKIFIIYSASGCWTDFYALGMLTADASANLLDIKSWKKSSKPVFKQSGENKVYAPGHNSFFKSPDGKEDWILYHANSKPGEGCGTFRSPRAQRFTWDKNGMPDFGIPVKEGVVLNIPSK